MQVDKSSHLQHTWCDVLCVGCCPWSHVCWGPGSVARASHLEHQSNYILDVLPVCSLDVLSVRVVLCSKCGRQLRVLKKGLPKVEVSFVPDIISGRSLRLSQYIPLCPTISHYILCDPMISHGKDMKRLFVSDSAISQPLGCRQSLNPNSGMWEPILERFRPLAAQKKGAEMDKSRVQER
jgi:hypothetical protein